MSLLCTLGLLLSATALASGYSTFRDRIPNGYNVPSPCDSEKTWDGVGHENPMGGGPRNPFGLDFDSQGKQWTKALCEMDSDGDGKTNGEELGDPQCTWTSAQDPPSASGITHPGICEPLDSDACKGKNDFLNCAVTNFDCDALHEPEMQKLEFRFPPTPIPTDSTSYFCMIYDLPSDVVYHHVALTPIIDNPGVMHHAFASGCSNESPVTDEPYSCGAEYGTDCDHLLGAWVLGTGGHCHNNITGVPFGKGLSTRVRIQLHFNNPEQREGIVDSSGVVFYFTKNLRENTAQIVFVGQNLLSIPPQTARVDVPGTCSADCSTKMLSQPVYIFESLNHMHYLGRRLTTVLYRDGQMVSVINNSTFDYNSPSLVKNDPPIEFRPGDVIKTTCTFNTEGRDEVTVWGKGSEDEMCYIYMLVYPGDAVNFIDCTSLGDQDFCGNFAT